MPSSKYKSDLNSERKIKKTLLFNLVNDQICSRAFLVVSLRDRCTSVP